MQFSLEGGSMSVALTKSDDFKLAIERAYRQVTEALRELDAVNAPADIGAHLDLALHRMAEALKSG